MPKYLFQSTKSKLNDQHTGNQEMHVRDPHDIKPAAITTKVMEMISHKGDEKIQQIEDLSYRGFVEPLRPHQ